MLKLVFFARFEPVVACLGHEKSQNALKMGRFRTTNGSKVGQKCIFPKVILDPFGMIKQVFLARFEPVVTRYGRWKIPKCLENGPFWDQKLGKVAKFIGYGRAVKMPMALHHVGPSVGNCLDRQILSDAAHECCCQRPLDLPTFLTLNGAWACALGCA